MTETSKQSPPISEDSVNDLAGAAPSPDLMPEITDIAVMEVTVEAVTVTAPFLVTNWLVVEGER